MDFLFIDTRDPIFGLIVLVFSILVVILLSYFWGIVAKRNTNEHIDKFLQKFNLRADDSKMLATLGNLDSGELLSMANGLAKIGDWQNCVIFYEKAVLNTKEPKQKASILNALAKAYIKVGFLEKAKEAYTELLGIFPRNETALFELIFVCEKLKNFEDAKQCLKALEIINGQNDEISAYLYALEILNSTNLAKQKLELLKNLTQTDLIKRFELELALENFENFDKNNLPPLELCVDLLGEKSEEFFDFKKNDKNTFGLKMLKAAKNNKIPAKLEFNYTCKDCSQNYPVFFARCPKCLKISSIVVNCIVTPKEV